MRPSPKRGYTLIEVLFALALVVFLTTVGAFAGRAIFSRSVDRGNTLTVSAAQLDGRRVAQFNANNGQGFQFPTSPPTAGGFACQLTKAVEGGTSTDPGDSTHLYFIDANDFSGSVSGATPPPSDLSSPCFDPRPGIFVPGSYAAGKAVSRTNDLGSSYLPGEISVYVDPARPTRVIYAAVTLDPANNSGTTRCLVAVDDLSGPTLWAEDFSQVPGKCDAATVGTQPSILASVTGTSAEPSAIDLG